MKVLRFCPIGKTGERVGELVNGRIRAYPAGTSLLDALFEGRRASEEEEWGLEEVRLLCPFKPNLIYGIGLNYPAHPLQKELGTEGKPAVPIIFLKGPNAAAGPNDDIPYPLPAKALDYEGELAFVIGPDGLPAAYAVADDLTARDLQKSERQWARAKGFDASCPFGPWLTSVDEVHDLGGLTLTTHVNGEKRQEMKLGHMIFSIREMIAAISETNTLSPGDLILTGSPTGTGVSFKPPVYLKLGDVVTVEIESLGRISHRIVEKFCRRAGLRTAGGL